jgi:hypothetical protein
MNINLSKQELHELLFCLDLSRQIKYLAEISKRNSVNPELFAKIQDFIFEIEEKENSIK